MRIEITLWWHADTVEVKRLDDVERFTIGMGADDDLFVPLTTSEGRSHTLLARGADGRVWLWPIDAPPMPLHAASDVELALGAFTVRVRVVSRERAAPVIATPDTRFANISTVTGAAMVALVALLVLTPTSVHAASDALPAASLRTWLTQTVTTRPTQWLAECCTAKGVEAPAPRARRDNPPALPGAGATGAGAVGPGADGGAKALAAVAALVAGGPVAQDGDVSDALARALDGVGPATGSTAGLSLRPGTLRVPTDSLGVGGIRVRKEGRAEGLDVGDATGRNGCGSDFGCRQEREPTMTVGKPMLLCGGAEAAGCDAGKEIIKRVVASHRDQLRFCYERALQASPGLAGKASIEWAISAGGAVTTATVKESDLPAAVSSCLVEKVKSWRFPPVPAWKDGVVVRYPFVFRHH